MHEQKVARPQWPIHDVLARRWSTRAFDGAPLAPGTLRSLFEAARWSPSSFNEQPWRFIVAPRQDADTFARAVGTLTPGNRLWAANAAALIFGVVTPALARTGQENMHAYYDLGGAVAMLTVEATSRGVFVHQMAGMDREAVRELYDVPPSFDVVIALAVGRRGDAAELDAASLRKERAERIRRDQSDFVFARHFGEAWPEDEG